MEFCIRKCTMQFTNNFNVALGSHSNKPNYMELTNWGIHLLKITFILEQQFDERKLCQNMHSSTIDESLKNMTITSEDDDDEDDRLRIRLVRPETEYERAVGNLKSKNSKDKRKRRENVAQKFIKECNETRLRFFHTEHGIGFWTPQSRRLAQVGHEILTPMWENWIRFEQSPKPRIPIRPAAVIRLNRLIAHRVGVELLQNWKNGMASKSSFSPPTPKPKVLENIYPANSKSKSIQHKRFSPSRFVMGL